MKLFIKNMVCPRCILVIDRELKELNLFPKNIELGIVEFESPLTEEQINSISLRLVPLGFELLNDSRNKQVEEIKNLLIKIIQGNKVEGHFSVKKYLSLHICKEYSYLSKLFSEKESITIEQYFILLKLEKVKELITYGEQTLNDIAWSLGYSSVQHLSAQFKRVLGMSTREFKNSISMKRKSIDQVGSEAT
jgi:AraC family transcriptional regulator